VSARCLIRQKRAELKLVEPRIERRYDIEQIAAAPSDETETRLTVIENI
jgi:hypothetical protein